LTKVVLVKGKEKITTYTGVYPMQTNTRFGMDMGPMLSKRQRRTQGQIKNRLYIYIYIKIFLSKLYFRHLHPEE